MHISFRTDSPEEKSFRCDVADWIDETLPDDLKNIVDGRAAIHVGKPHGVKFAPKGRQRSTIKMVRNDPEADRETFHPTVRKHPETVRKSLFINPVYTARLDGMSEAESAPILDRLYWHATRPEFCCRHRWQAEDLVIWDNRCFMHRAMPYDVREPRRMRGTRVAGDGEFDSGMPSGYAEERLEQALARVREGKQWLSVSQRLR